MKVGDSFLVWSTEKLSVPTLFRVTFLDPKNRRVISVGHGVEYECSYETFIAQHLADVVLDENLWQWFKRVILRRFA